MFSAMVPHLRMKPLQRGIRQRVQRKAQTQMMLHLRRL